VWWGAVSSCAGVCCLAGLHGFFFSVGMGGVFYAWHCAYHVLCTHGVW